MSEKFYESIKEAAERYTEAGWGDSSFNDSCFLIERGATKSPNPKTEHMVETRFRHLPHHVKTATDGLSDSTVDIPHLRNALAREPLVKVLVEDSVGFHARAKSHLEKHAKNLLKTYQKSSAEFKEIETICKEFNITLDEADAAGANTKVVKNGPTEKP